MHAKDGQRLAASAINLQQGHLAAEAAERRLRGVADGREHVLPLQGADVNLVQLTELPLLRLVPNPAPGASKSQLQCGRKGQPLVANALYT